MKTKLLKRLRKNYSLIEYKERGLKPYYKWKQRHVLLKITFFVLIFPIAIFYWGFTKLDLIYLYAYIHPYSIDLNDKYAIFDDFREKKVSYFVRKHKAKRLRKRIKTKKVWY